MTTKSAKCERTGQNIPLTDGYLVGSVTTGEWSFVSASAIHKPLEYNIAVKSLTATPEAMVDWLAHLHEKTWFVHSKFFDFFHRFRNEIN